MFQISPLMSGIDLREQSPIRQARHDDEMASNWDQRCKLARVRLGGAIDRDPRKEVDNGSSSSLRTFIPRATGSPYQASNE